MTNQESDPLKPLTSFRIDNAKNKARPFRERRTTELPGSPRDSLRKNFRENFRENSKEDLEQNSPRPKDAPTEKSPGNNKAENLSSGEGKNNSAQKQRRWLNFFPWVSRLVPNLLGGTGGTTQGRQRKSAGKNNPVTKPRNGKIDRGSKTPKAESSRIDQSNPVINNSKTAPPADRRQRTPFPQPPSPPNFSPRSRPASVGRKSSPTNPSSSPLSGSFSRRQPPKPSLSNPKATVIPKTARPLPKEKKELAIVYGLRLLILGVGLGAIAGTVLYILDPATRPGSETLKVEANLASSKTPSPSSSPAGSLLTVLKLQQDIPALQGQLDPLLKARPNLQAGVFLQDLDNGSFVSILGDTPFPAASTIKIAVLIAFFQDVDAGKINLADLLTLEKKFVAGGSGELQDQPLGTKYTSLDVATRMMVTSDNTATNMLIDRLGGLEVLNQRFQSWGLKSTSLQAVLPDLEGTNLTTPKELATLLAGVEQGELVSRRSRDLILGIMRRTENDSLLPQGLEKNATIAHKTGSLGTLIADAGLIDMPSGKRYLLVAIVKRPRNDPQGTELVKQISRTVYNYFKIIPPTKKP